MLIFKVKLRYCVFIVLIRSARAAEHNLKGDVNKGCVMDVIFYIVQQVPVPSFIFTLKEV